MAGRHKYRSRLVDGRRGGGPSVVVPAVAIHRLSVVEIAPSPRHCFRTAHPCAQSDKGSPTEPVISRSSRQRLGHLQSHFDGFWHVCQAVFPEPQSAAACRRVELVGDGTVGAGDCRLSCASNAAGNSPPDVMRGDTDQKAYTVQVRWFQ